MLAHYILRNVGSLGWL